MDKAKFTMKDESFTCLVCGKEILPLGYTARDHCPYCLCSLHVDNNPGDRLCECHGILKPINVEKGPKDELKIVYKCSKCGNTLDRDLNASINISWEGIKLYMKEVYT